MMSVIRLRAEKAPLVVCWFEGRLGMEKGNEWVVPREIA
jgi:hypothetical protein